LRTGAGFGGRPHDHGTGRGRYLRHLGDVGDDARHVVRSAALDGRVHEGGDSPRRVALPQQGRDLLVGQHPRQPIGAQHDPIPGVDLADAQVRLDGVDPVDRADEQVAAPVGRGLRLGDLPGVDEGLHVGVVLRQP
jgi:hypothetical protein